MARTYAKIYVAIWAGDFRGLSIGAQGLYFRLLTDAKLSMCGVVDWRPKRLVQSFAGMTVPQLRALAAELQDAGYIVVDDDTEEALIRTFVKHDGVLKSPNLTKAMASDWLAVTSQTIKNVVVDEVRRAIELEPTLKGSYSVPDWFQIGSADPKGEPFQIGSNIVPLEFPDPATSNLQPATDICPTVADAPAEPIKLDPDKPAPKGTPNTILDAEFPTFYDQYPRKAAPAKAREKFRAARKKASLTDILAGLDTYKRTKPSYADWAFPASWLNGERWLDQAEPDHDDSWDRYRYDPDTLEGA